METIKDWLYTHQQQLKCDFAGIACNVSKEDKPKEIRWIYVAGNQSEAYKKIRLQVGKGIAGLVWKTARTQLDEGILDQPEKMIEYPIARIEKLQMALAAPVILQEEVVAVLMLGYRNNHSFTRNERVQLERLTCELSTLFKEEKNA